MRLTAQDVDDLARGAAFLGSGGGCDPYYGNLMVQRALAEGCTIELLDPDELPDDALVIPTALMGAPTVLVEKLPRGDEALLSLRRLEAHLGRQAFATMSLECGGINSTIPLLVGARLGLPVVDADGMGRAFPELHMETFHIHGISGTPMTITNEHGDTALLTTHNNPMLEWLARGITVRMGGSAFIAEYPMDGRDVKRAAVPRTLSLAMRIGRGMRRARAHKRDVFVSLVELLHDTPYHTATVLFDGKVIDVLRQTTDGFARGSALLEARTDGKRKMELVFQNEYLVARVNGDVQAIVPDLICVLDPDTAEPITTEALRYGQRVKVMAVGVPPFMRTPAALAVFGPHAFGLAEPFRPLESLL